VDWKLWGSGRTRLSSFNYYGKSTFEVIENGKKCWLLFMLWVLLMLKFWSIISNEKKKLLLKKT